MTDSKQETERKYDAPSVDDTTWLPDLTGVGGIVSVVDQGTQDLDAVYYDTDDLRLAGASATLRRRTGGTDAGWHLKLPLTGDSREEVHAPCPTRSRTHCATWPCPAPGAPNCGRSCASAPPARYGNSSVPAVRLSPS